MNTAIKNNRKTRFPKGKKILVSAVTGALGILMAPDTYATANSFADTPLRLQEKSITQEAYSVKPNVLLFIDDSGSMHYRLRNPDPSKTKYLYKCLYKLGPREAFTDTWEAQKGKDGKGWTSDLTYEEYREKVKQGYLCNKYRRIDPAKEILYDIVTDYHNDMYFAIHRLNNFSTSPKDWENYFHDTENPKEYAAMLKYIAKLPTGGGTPSTRQFPVIARNLVMNQLKYRCQKSYIVFLSDGLTNDQYSISDKSFNEPNKDLDEFFDKSFSTQNERKTFFEHADHLTERLGFYSKTLANPAAHTDPKDPNTPLGFGPYIYSENYYNGTGKGASGITKNISAKLRTTDEAGKPWNSIDSLTQKPFFQTAQTYTIGFALAQEGDEDDGKDPDANPDKAYQYLRLGAVPPAHYPNGNFFNADSRQQIRDAFKTIFDQIKSEVKATAVNVTTNAPSIGVSSTSTNDIGITARIETGNWSSQLCIHDLTNKNSKDKGQTIDKNDCKVQPSFANRQLLINDGNTTYLYSNLTPDQGLDNNSFEISTNADKNKREWLDGLLTWLSRAKEDKDIKQDGFVLDYRERPDSARNMGDIIDNTIVTAGGIEFNKQKYLITSANDGMVYVFRAADDPNHPYDLKFNYMPMSIERDSYDGSDIVGHYYKDLLNKDYGKNSLHPHRYLLNGGIVVRETADRDDVKAGNQIFMVSTMGQAGRGAFAINIGGQDIVSGNNIAAENIGSGSWYKGVSLFQTPSGEDNLFGYTIGTPAIARIRVNRDTNASDTTYTDHIRETALISNGYNYSGAATSSEGSDDESALYIYDALGVDVGTKSFQKTGDPKGTLIRKLVAAKEGESDGGGGLSSPTGVDINNDGVTDLAYAADYKGNVYRFDFRSPDPAKWTVNKIFSANAPITSAPAVFLAPENKQDPLAKNKVVVVFGTGSDIYQSDRDSLEQQTIYGIYDNYNEHTATLINKNSLLQQVMTYSDTYSYLSNKPFSSARYKGWYFNLNTDGERVTESIQKLVTTGTVMTRTYSVNKDGQLNDPCQTSSQIEKTKLVSHFTQFNALTGGALTENDAHIMIDADNPLANSIKMDDAVGLLITNPNGYDNLNSGASGKEKKLGETPVKNCLRKAPKGIDDKGNIYDIKGVVMCPVSINRLSWREVKTGYLS